jgi:hypothetical protein
MTIHHVAQSDNIPAKYIPTILEWIQTASPYQLGVLGELIAVDWLTNTGYLVERARGCDLIAGDTVPKDMYRVEVKTARMSADGTYQFVLFKRDHTDHKLSEFVVMLCVCPDGYIVAFVVPVSALLLVTKVTIPTDPRAYRGRFARYSNLPGTISLNV